MKFFAWDRSNVVDTAEFRAPQKGPEIWCSAKIVEKRQKILLGVKVKSMAFGWS